MTAFVLYSCFAAAKVAIFALHQGCPPLRGVISILSASHEKNVLTAPLYILYQLFLNTYVISFVFTPQVISKADFIATVVNFDTDSLTSPVIKTVEDVFKAAGDLTADTVNRASKACGPLYNVGCSCHLFRAVQRFPVAIALES